MGQRVILGVVPARGGSKSVPRKNLLPLGGGDPLVVRALKSAWASTLLTDVVVSTDDAEIAGAAISAGGIVVTRPRELATDDAGMVPVLRHAVASRGGPRPDLVVTLQPCAPFRTGRMIDATISKVLETGADSAQTVRDAMYHPYYMSLLDCDRLVPLYPYGHHYVTRQSCPPVYQPNGAVYVTRYETLLKGKILGEDNRAVVCDVEESVNIDTPFDVRIAEMLVRAEAAW